jgi:sulfite reductase (NADPH) hemoprotein beta-component
MADLAERYSFDELRVTHAQNIVLPHVARRVCTRCGRRWTRTASANANLDLVTTSSPAPASIIAALANARSIPVAQKIAQRFAIERQARSAS